MEVYVVFIFNGQPTDVTPRLTTAFKHRYNILKFYFTANRCELTFSVNSFGKQPIAERAYRKVSELEVWGTAFVLPDPYPIMLALPVPDPYSEFLPDPTRTRVFTRTRRVISTTSQNPVSIVSIGLELNVWQQLFVLQQKKQNTIMWYHVHILDKFDK